MFRRHKTILSMFVTLFIASSAFAGELHVAAQNGELDKVKQLISQGANPQEKDHNGFMPIHYAAQEGHTTVVDFFIFKGVDVNVRGTIANCTPLYLASARGHIKLVELLVNKGSDINIADDRNGMLPIHCAAVMDHTAVVDFFISKGVDVNVRGLDDYTPLHFASGEGSIKVAELLLNKGVDINIGNKYGVKPLHLAVQREQTDIVKFLLQKGAIINTKDDQGFTPLHWGIEYGKLSIVELLLNSGADVNMANNNGVTPMKLAINKGYPRMQEIIKIHGGKLENHKELVKYVQSQLRLRGYGTDTVNGEVGSATVNAVKSYQQDAGLKPDGKITESLPDHLASTGKFNYSTGKEVMIKTNIFVSFYDLVHKYNWNHGGVYEGFISPKSPKGISGDVNMWRVPDYSPDCSAFKGHISFGNLEINGELYINPPNGFVFKHGSIVKIVSDKK